MHGRMMLNQPWMDGSPMKSPSICDLDYINWLVASPRVASCTEVAACSPTFAAHDSYTRLLRRLEPDPQVLWDEAKPLVKLNAGFLVIDDSTLDKPYARKIELVGLHWSGKHNRVVKGINLITLLWTDGDIAVPIDWRVFNKDADALTKNDHARQMLETARQRGFEPRCVLWDAWYSSTQNLKLVRSFGWRFFVGLKSNRHVNPDGHGNRALSELDWSGLSQQVHLKGFGWVEAYRVTDSRGEHRYFVSSERDLDEAQVQQHRELAYQIEGYHRGIKQECHIERCQARTTISQLNHIALSIRAFLRLEAYRYRTGSSRHETKWSVFREVVRSYLERPFVVLAW